ncbi:D-xylose ABC transporter substrate-binding protein [Sporosarcina ureilytica]|uniref:D-xylose ABC transporter substrate-binding protein n=1 Tax=Sporosarcina ureilytica TaxID=298596 RepID=A0A1D8JJ10_9BACL|nr:D-xylose ABC transporter substrate-binding protein [Sporosarcina ureilytica]AOV08714.1 D-xylose ABC transporter substrate-binding protein [Sporosarcina ureilytica]
MKKYKSMIWAVLILGMLMILAACGQDAGTDVDNQEDKVEASDDTDEKEFKIGLSIPDLTLERWQHDRDHFVQTAEELGATVLVQSANSDEANQLSQIQNMISQGIDALVIIAINSDALIPAVEQAKAEGIPVLAYDRLINNVEIDAYVSFDNIKVGEMQAEGVLAEKSSGKFFMLGGSPTDFTAKLVREGQMNIVQPLVDSGEIEVIGDQWAKNWDASEAMAIIENTLTVNKDDIDAIVASNDSTAGGAIQALAGQGLAGKVAVSGQDADLAAVQRIVEGTQSMTVYKPIKELAVQSANAAVALAKGEKVEGDGSINNGVMDVPFLKLDIVLVNADNVIETVIKDGFHTYDDVYKNVPEDERPPRP